MKRRVLILTLVGFAPGIGAPDVKQPTRQPLPQQEHAADNRTEAGASRFQFRDNDFVALLGAGFFERDYDYGYLEIALLTAFPTMNLRFRNLAWSADTVWGHSRSYFGPPGEGLDRLRSQLGQLKPTVVLCNYGSAEAWDGAEKLGPFLEGYERLLDMVAETPGNPRVLLIPPLPVETLPPPFPNLEPQNQRLALYRDAIKKLAAQRGLGFCDAFQLVTNAAKPGPVTENGVAYSEAGYRFVAGLIPSLVGPAAQAGSNAIDEKLRAMVLEKNRLFFHRWRPANETYLFGFRKHEQGNNAAEIPLFDPLIAEREKEIAHALGRREP